MRGGTGARNAKALTKKLAELVGGQGRTTKKGQSHLTSKRVDVVNGDLCDDVIKYLAPTLEQHNGCSLIDIHPGPCLFSSKIHDFLKPKVHVLVEPDQRYLEPFIKPLLDAPGSMYRHIVPLGKSPAAQWSNLRKMQKSASLIPDMTRKPLIYPERRKFDPSLLVIGNLARRRQGRIFERAIELVPLVMYQMGYDVLASEGFQTDALVRMLWWLPELYKPSIVPANLPYNRSSFNVALDMALETSEVAGVTPTQALMDTRTINWVPRKRLGSFDEVVSKAVADKMKKLNMTVPKGRRLQQSEREYLRPDRNVKSVSPLSGTAETPTALRAKINETSARVDEHSPWLGNPRVKYASDKALIEAGMKSLKYPQCKANHQHPTQDVRQVNEQRVAVLFDLCLRLLNLEASLKNLEDNKLVKAELETFRNDILSIDKSINDLIENAPDKTRNFIEHLIEDQLAFYCTPRLMAWDRRSYEPLQANPSDFWPNFEMALLDFTPKSTDLYVPDLTDSRECSRFCVELLRSLFSAKNQSLPSALDKVGINAGKDLIPMVPAITDVRKGGRLNPNNLKVQMLTTEMVEGLVKAFFEWPFRPEKWELTLAHGEEEISSGSAKTEEGPTYTE